MKRLVILMACVLAGCVPDYSNEDRYDPKCRTTITVYSQTGVFVKEWTTDARVFKTSQSYYWTNQDGTETWVSGGIMVLVETPRETTP